MGDITLTAQRFGCHVGLYGVGASIIYLKAHHAKSAWLRCQFDTLSGNRFAPTPKTARCGQFPQIEPVPCLDDIEDDSFVYMRHDKI